MVKSIGKSMCTGVQTWSHGHGLLRACAVAESMDCEFTIRTESEYNENVSLPRILQQLSGVSPEDFVTVHIRHQKDPSCCKLSKFGQVQVLHGNQCCMHETLCLYYQCLGHAWNKHVPEGKASRTPANVHYYHLCSHFRFFSNCKLCC